MGSGELSLLGLPEGQGSGQNRSVGCFKLLWFGPFLLHEITGPEGVPRWNLWDKLGSLAAVRVAGAFEM